MLNVSRLSPLMMTLELFNANFALHFFVGVHTYLARRRSSYCKEFPVLIFFPTYVLISIPGRERRTLPCPIAEFSTNVMLYILHWPESAMPVSVEGSNFKPKENLLLKTSLAHHFGVSGTPCSQHRCKHFWFG